METRHQKRKDDIYSFIDLSVQNGIKIESIQLYPRSNNGVLCIDVAYFRGDLFRLKYKKQFVINSEDGVVSEAGRLEKMLARAGISFTGFEENHEKFREYPSEPIYSARIECH